MKRLEFVSYLRGRRGEAGPTGSVALSLDERGLWFSVGVRGAVLSSAALVCERPEGVTRIPLSGHADAAGTASIMGWLGSPGGVEAHDALSSGHATWIEVVVGEELLRGSVRRFDRYADHSRARA